MSMSISSDKTVLIKILKSTKIGYRVIHKKDIKEIYTVIQETQRDSDKRIASPFQIWNFNEISWGETTVFNAVETKSGKTTVLNGNNA